jgi:hypothetical protein
LPDCLFELALGVFRSTNNMIFDLVNNNFRE